MRSKTRSKLVSQKEAAQAAYEHVYMATLGSLLRGPAHDAVTREDRIRALGRIAPHQYVTPKRGCANLPCLKCGLPSWAAEHKKSVSDGFQVTAVGMKKVAEAKRRDFLLMARNSETEAENLRREGNVERAKKFLAQEAKWRAMAARSDEEIYREYKTSQQ
jgi:hypothetical protein